MKKINRLLLLMVAFVLTFSVIKCDVVEAKTKSPSKPTKVCIDKNVRSITWKSNTENYDYVQIEFIVGVQQDTGYTEGYTYRTGWMSSSNLSRYYGRYETWARKIQCVRIRSANYINGKYYKSAWNYNFTWVFSENGKEQRTTGHSQAWWYATGGSRLIQI